MRTICSTMIDFTLIKSGEEFEMFCEDLLKAKGYDIASRPARGPDGGKDMIISFEYTDPLGFNERLRILIECKHFAKSNRSVREEHVGNIVERTLANNCLSVGGCARSVSSSPYTSSLRKAASTR